jgi:hypothetical protein
MKKVVPALALLFGGSAFATDTVTLSGDILKILDGKGRVLYQSSAPGDDVQAKLNSVPSGGSLVIPAGVTVGALRGKSGVTIESDGAVTVNGNWDFSGLGGWTVRGKAPGQGFVFQGVRIDATGASRFAVGNNVFTGQPSNGFDGSAIKMNGASFGTVINNDFTSAQGNVLGVYNLDNMTFDGNHFTNCWQPFSIQTPAPPNPSFGRNIVIQRNVFLGTQRAAIEVGPNATGWEYFSGIVVDNNYFDSFNNAGGSNADALLAISLVGQASINTTVTNNFIRLGPKNAGSGVAIEVTGTGLTKNNVIWGWRFAGFTYQNGWTVRDNVQYQVATQWYANTSNTPVGTVYNGTFANNQMIGMEPADPGWPARIPW